MGFATSTSLIHSLLSTLHPSVSNQLCSLCRCFLEDGRGAQTKGKDSKAALLQKARGRRQGKLRQGVRTSLLSQQWLRSGFSSCPLLLALQMHLTMFGCICRAGTGSRAMPGKRSDGPSCRRAPLHPRGPHRPLGSFLHQAVPVAPTTVLAGKHSEPSPACSPYTLPPTPTRDKAELHKSRRKGKGHNSCYTPCRDN